MEEPEESESKSPEQIFLDDLADFADPTTVKIPSGMKAEPKDKPKDRDLTARAGSSGETKREYHPLLHRRIDKDLWRKHNQWIHDIILARNWDWWTLEDGGERVGKSSVAAITCAQRDPSFAEHWKERIYYMGSEALEHWNKSERGSSSMLDEAAEAWYKAKWYDDVNLALDMATVQLGDRNLDIHILTPSLGLVGAQALRRTKEWLNVQAKNYVRGYMEMRRPHWTIYGNKRFPFWGKPPKGSPDLIHYFREIKSPWAEDNGFPGDWYAQYAEFKLKAGIARVANYIRSAKDTERPKRSLADQVTEAMAKVETSGGKRFVDKNFRNSRGSVDWRSVAFHLDYPENVARTVAGQLVQQYGRNKIATGQVPAAEEGLPPAPKRRRAKKVVVEDPGKVPSLTD